MAAADISQADTSTREQSAGVMRRTVHVSAASV